ncbi:hypothetical protein [Christiangramia echinicola]|uniref:hypothetical protein n=1 Tax=Christiangramia echinicola TaxID=279359 RepID=UPI000407BAF7|nr:hypothetical protein [Christiangramia echinicola]
MIEITHKEIQLFQERIINWFEENGRTFPWRNPSANNYQKIISEVLLQRTQATTVSNFFPSFIEKYPSWKRLGLATELDLQEALKPIGLYKQRAARMYKLAQEMKRRKGRFPKTRQEAEKLPMMGQYISNAYELFILNNPSPLLDVNMARVLERFFGPRKLADIRHDPYLQSLSKRVVDYPKKAQINWAILDFASLVCKKRSPNCQICPLYNKCKYQFKNI